MSTKRPVAPPRGNRSFVGLIVMLLVLGVAAIGYVMFKAKPSATIVAAPPSVSAAPTTPDADAKPLPAPKGWVEGSEKAPIEIVMYGDFECPGCGQFARLTEPDVETQLVKTGKVRFRFMDYPLPSIHKATLVAHNAAACAGAQNKFWEMHNRIYELQHEWSWFANNRDMNAPKVMKRYASELGLDGKAFETCLDAKQFETQIRSNYEEGNRLGVGSTPTFIIGIRMIAGAQPYDVIKKLVDSATADAKKLSTSSTPK
jgi:protein-disulfide isomerase